MSALNHDAPARLCYFNKILLLGFFFITNEHRDGVSDQLNQSVRTN